MRNLIHRFAILAALFMFAVSAGAAKRADHVFLVSIDGGKPTVIQQSQMPVLDQFVADGAHTWMAQTIFPSITLPSHVSMLTGVGPQTHKILWNNWQPAAGAVKVPTVFSEAKQAGLSTAMFVGKEKFRHLDSPGTVDEFSYNRAPSGKVVKKTDGQPAVVKEGTVLAKTVAADAAAYIAAHKPNLCFIHLADPDNVGHKYGWGSREQIKSLADVDAALGVILQAIREAGLADTSVVIVTVDHGGHAKTHGLNIPDDMNIPWIAWGKGVKKKFTITAPVSTCDTAATALWLLDVPRPAKFDGHPVTSAFE